MRKFFVGVFAALSTGGVTVIAVKYPQVGYSLVAVVLLASVIALSRPVTRRVTLIICGVIAIAGASSVFVAEGVTGLVLRAVGIGLIVVSTLGHDKVRPRVRGPANWQLLFLIPLGTFIYAATLPHGQTEDALSYGLALVLLGVLLYSLPRLPGETLWLGVSIALLLLLGASLVYGLLEPNLALEGGRLRGLLENANTLGFIAFAATALAVLGNGHKPLRMVMLGVAAASLVWTGSRASLLAVLLVFAFWLLTRNWVAGAFALLFAWVVSGPVLNAVAQMNPQIGLLLRDNNSRVGSWDTAIADWQTSPTFGVGLAQETSIIASSQLRALAQGGAVGLLAICVMCVAILLVSLATTRGGAIFAFAAVCHSLFEGWLLSPVAPLLLIFFLGWCALTAQGLENRGITSSNIPSTGEQRRAKVRSQLLTTGRW